MKLLNLAIFGCALLALIGCGTEFTGNKQEQVEYYMGFVEDMVKKAMYSATWNEEASKGLATSNITRDVNTTYEDGGTATGNISFVFAEEKVINETTPSESIWFEEYSKGKANIAFEDVKFIEQLLSSENETTYTINGKITASFEQTTTKDYLSLDFGGIDLGDIEVNPIVEGSFIFKNNGPITFVFNDDNGEDAEVQLVFTCKVVWEKGKNPLLFTEINGEEYNYQSSIDLITFVNNKQLD